MSIATRTALYRFFRQPTMRRRLLVEAFVWLLFARLLLWVIPFRHLTLLLRRTPSAHFDLPEPERQRFKQDVRWAVNRAAGLLPGETVCFPRGIAAQAICRRRGIPAIMYYGAASAPGKGLSAHVWVLDGTDGIVGHQLASEFRVLARFPE
jgi:Transglutaminase-like superfamily